MTVPPADASASDGRFLTVDECARRLGIKPDDDQRALISDWIASVEGAALDRLPRLQSWVDDGRVAAATVRGVLAVAVGRVLTEIDAGIGTEQETHPEWSTRVTASVAKNGLLTAADLAALTPTALAPATGRARVGMYSLAAQGMPVQRDTTGFA